MGHEQEQQALDVRDRLRTLADEAYAKVEWSSGVSNARGDRIEFASIGEIPVVPDWLLSLATRREFGEVGTVDQETGEISLSSETVKKLEDLLLMIVSWAGSAGAGHDLPPHIGEAAGAISLLQTQSVPPNWEDMSEQQTAAAAMSATVLCVSYWVSQVLIGRLRELRLEERTRG